MPSCTIKTLPYDQLHASAATAIQINPANTPSVFAAEVSNPHGMADPGPHPDHLALLTTKYWGAKGVALTVSFLEPIAQELKDRILLHMNAWKAYCNAVFTQVASGGQVRISLQGDGYYSYLGTDILSIPANQETMNFQDFSMNTPESEYHRVVRHETGHTLGFPHEHMRKELVARLDPVKTVIYFLQTQGWSPAVTQAQVLTPLDDSSIRATTLADQDSIMCYQLPASITVDGQPIRGGVDIDALDQQFCATLYPLTVNPPPVKPPVKPNGGNVSPIITDVLAFITALGTGNLLAALAALAKILGDFTSGKTSQEDFAAAATALKQIK